MNFFKNTISVMIVSLFLISIIGCGETEKLDAKKLGNFNLVVKSINGGVYTIEINNETGEKFAYAIIPTMTGPSVTISDLVFVDGVMPIVKIRSGLDKIVFYEYKKSDESSCITKMFEAEKIYDIKEFFTK